MKGIRTTKGDVFAVKINEGSKKYFQYVANDLTLLNSDVIRAFKKVYVTDVSPTLSEIIKDEVEFYAHSVTKWGIKLELWEKVGHIANVGKNDVVFRGTNDYGSRPGEQVKVSQRWYIWRINEEFTRVGKLEGENQNAEIGIVVNPYDIVRMRTGKYSFVYPEF